MLELGIDPYLKMMKWKTSTICILTVVIAWPQGYFVFMLSVWMVFLEHKELSEGRALLSSDKAIFQSVLCLKTLLPK